MRVHSCDLLSTMLCSCSKLCVPHDQRLQAVVCALCIDQIQNSLTIVAGVRVFGIREDQHPVVVVNAAFIVAHAHGGRICVQDALTGKINVHPLIYRCIGGGNARHVVLANRHIFDAILCEDGKIALAIGTNVGIRRGQFLRALLSSTIVAAITQLDRLQASLCALAVHTAQELVLVSFILMVQEGVFFFHHGSCLRPDLCSICGNRLEGCGTKNHSHGHRSGCDLLYDPHLKFHKTSSVGFCNLFATLPFHKCNYCATIVSQKCLMVKRFSRILMNNIKF